MSLNFLVRFEAATGTVHTGLVREQPITGGRFFPHHVIPDWLGPDVSAKILDYAIQHESDFVPTSVRYRDGGRIDPEVRSSLKLPQPGPFRDLVAGRAIALKGELEARFGMPAFALKSVEVELVAHGDGDCFRSHVDTMQPQRPEDGLRRLTFVYYLCRQPRRFTGGEIRLYAIDTDAVIDIAPNHDLLLAFPSHARHSVERLSCPDPAFANRRFAVNIWLHG